MSVITHAQLKSNYLPVKPLNGYVVAEVTEKPSERILDSGIIVNESVMENDRPFLVIVEMSPEASEKFPGIKIGDIVEVVEAGRGISFVYGLDMEKLAIFDSKHIAAVYSQKEGVVREKHVPKLNLV